MGGPAKKVVSTLGKTPLNPLKNPLLPGLDLIAGGVKSLFEKPDLPEPPEEREIEEPGADQAQKLLRDRRAKRRRQTPTILTSPLGANPSPAVSRTTLGGV